MESYSTHSSGMTGRHSGSDKALLIDIPDMAAGNDADSGSEADCDLDIEEPIYESLAVLQQDPPSEVIYAELPGVSTVAIDRKFVLPPICFFFDLTKPALFFHAFFYLIELYCAICSSSRSCTAGARRASARGCTS